MASKWFRLNALFAAIATLFCLCESSAQAQPTPSTGVKNIVLVHGAWADGSSWSKVIPLLISSGFHVTAVQLPLTGLNDDVATVERALALEVGPVLLVGHSYGGSVISEAGNDPKVVGVVYVAAFAPNDGQSTLDLINANPTPVGAQLLQSGGYFKLSREGVFQDFAPDLTEGEKEILFATQGPTAGAAFATPLSSPAWKTKPAWFIIAQNDRVISPALERMEAEAMNAKSILIPSGHVVMLSHPEAVADFIEQAAR